MADKDQVTEVNWRDCEKVHSYFFFTNLHHSVHVKRESIPIVFVPGIMGTRLRRADSGQNMVWDPNSTYTFMAPNYLFASAKKRKKNLIDRPLKVVEPTDDDMLESFFLRQMFFDDDEIKLDWDWLPLPYYKPGFFSEAPRRRKVAALLAEQGWGEPAWGFYGKILKKLASQDYGPLKRCFMFPVYATGYNWLQDNDKSGADIAKKIEKIIDREKNFPDRECNRVIIVSHSMGGLVSRSAMMLHGADGKCHGAIHGAQPVTGAPAAYRRMRAGFESPESSLFDAPSHVLGNTSAKVLPILANCIGGLQLLPNANYRTNQGATEWLSLKRQNGESVIPSVPKKDPYEEIYLKEQGFLRLVLHPELFDPGAKPGNRDLGTGGAGTKARITFIGNVNAAKRFHEKLGMKQHAYTTSSFVSGGKSTFDTVQYRFNHSKDIAPVWVAGPRGTRHLETPTIEQGSGIDLDLDQGQEGYYEIQPPNGAGDSTVPQSSGSALEQKHRVCPPVTGVEHSAFYDNETVQAFTVNSIKDIAQKYLDDEMKGRR